jgi:hypothetical protein
MLAALQTWSEGWVSRRLKTFEQPCEFRRCCKTRSEDRLSSADQV